MNTTTLITGTVSSLGTTSAYTIHDKKVDVENLKNVGIGTLVTTGSVASSAACNSLINQAYLSKIQIASTTSYVESMSDEELEQALLALNMVQNEELETDVKMI